MNPKSKLILVLSDGLRYDTAVSSMGFMWHMVESGRASLYKVISQVPSFSRPMYETIHTGLTPIEHGIVSNYVLRRSNQPNVFEAAVKAGRTTAAAAYSWFSELYNRAPYDLIMDREVDDASLLIQHGRFYSQDEFPDVELFAMAAGLVRRFSPDYLLVHPMGMDYAGLKHGFDSSEYRYSAIRQDVALANLILEWMELGYHIIVTADHGINKDGIHGGSTPDEREVALYLIQQDAPGKGDTREVISQLRIAPTLCRLLDVPIPPSMTQPPITD
jgi:predicted AlkP superfamily pyrophosphatase or phosphodiesterase